MMSAFSIGLGGAANKLIVPPQLHRMLVQDPLSLERMICMQRGLFRQLFNRFGDANAIFGFPTFKFTDED